ncbi:trypco2 family protein [Streptomyces sp. NPDC101219]|uniref:trypco2 family protein n=1 Tax=Streptomyces sp. NPDC101219 TaxID=3366131 RepID=UPI0037F2289B
MAAEMWVGLADAVRGVRAELDAAQKEGAGREVGFEVGQIELEFAVDVRKEAAGEAGARVYVLSLGARGSVAATATNRMKLVLTPKDQQDRSLRVVGPVEQQIPPE